MRRDLFQCRNKRLIHRFLEDRGVNIAKEFSKENYQLPIFIKPIDGSRSVDTYIIKEKEELKDYKTVKFIYNTENSNDDIDNLNNYDNN